MVGATEYDAVVLDVMLPGPRRLRDLPRACARRASGCRSSCSRPATRSRTGSAGSTPAPTTTSPSRSRWRSCSARLRALARRGPVERPTVLEVGDLRLDPATREVWRGDQEIELSAREFALLETFMRRPGQVLTQLQLLEAAWDLGYEQRSNVVEVYVRYLREKIDRPFGVKSLETVRGAGYRLRKDGGRVSRLPIRVRLTAAFALAMVLVLAGRRPVRLPAPQGRSRRQHPRGPRDSGAGGRRRRLGRRRGAGGGRGGLRPAARADGRVLDSSGGVRGPALSRPSCERAERRTSCCRPPRARNRGHGAGARPARGRGRPDPRWWRWGNRSTTATRRCRAWSRRSPSAGRSRCCSRRSLGYLLAATGAADRSRRCAGARARSR